MSKIACKAGLALLVALLGGAPALATDWIVDASNGPGTHFTSIQAAVAAANPGDRILVRPGTYSENVFVDKGVSIVGWNAAQYPLNVPANPYQSAIWGWVAIANIPANQTCVVSGVNVVRPTSAGGEGFGILNSQGAIIVDRVIMPNGGMVIAECPNVILEQVRIRHFADTPTTGLLISNSKVQANDIDITGGDLAPNQGTAPKAGTALEVTNQAVVALARPRIIGGYAGGPWTTPGSVPDGGTALRCIASWVSIVDENPTQSYLIGGQGGECGAGRPGTPSGNGGDAIIVEQGGLVHNKQPLAAIPGPPGANNGGGPTGSAGLAFIELTGGAYAPVNDVPALLSTVAAPTEGGFLVISHHAKFPGAPVVFVVFVDFGLSLYPPSVQFLGGNPSTALLFIAGLSDAAGWFQLTTGISTPIPGLAGTTVVVQTADIEPTGVYLANPIVIAFGF